MPKFAIIFTYKDGSTRRDTSTWENKAAVRAKARKLRNIFKNVKIVFEEEAKIYPNICQ